MVIKPLAVVKIIGENTVKSLEPSLDAAISSSGSF